MNWHAAVSLLINALKADIHSFIHSFWPFLYDRWI